MGFRPVCRCARSNAGENAFVAPFADVAISGSFGDMEVGGHLLEGLCGERPGQAGEELLFGKRLRLDVSDA